MQYRCTRRLYWCTIYTIVSYLKSQWPINHPLLSPLSTAYGYGFLISVAISLTSLLAIFIVPFLKEGTTLGKFYKAIYAFMMGSSSSALFCDAILIILPEVGDGRGWGLE